MLTADWLLKILLCCQNEAGHVQGEAGLQFIVASRGGVQLICRAGALLHVQSSHKVIYLTGRQETHKLLLCV